MSKQSVLDFFEACATDESVMQHYLLLNINELLLHARSAGYDFTLADMAGVIGSMEVNVIMERNGEEINAFSSLWLKMWGKPRLQYVIEELYSTYKTGELKQFLD